jgi:hypothetical protein
MVDCSDYKAYTLDFLHPKDLLEFDFGPWVWQVVSGEMALAIEALLPGAFKLTRVSVL